MNCRSLVLPLLTVVLFGCDRMRNKANEPQYEIAEAYAGLRKQVLDLRPGDLSLPSEDHPAVIAVLMETGYSEAVVTLVAVADGSASLYFSNGGGVIGAGDHEEVTTAAKSFVSSSQEYLPKASPTETYPLPQRGSVRFYLVTGKGIYTAQGVKDDLGYNRHEFSGLFHKGHELIAAIRERTG